MPDGSILRLVSQIPLKMLTVFEVKKKITKMIKFLKIVLVESVFEKNRNELLTLLTTARKFY